MKNAAFTSAEAQYRFGYRFGELNDGADAGEAETDGQDATPSWQDELDLGLSDDATDGATPEDPASEPEAEESGEEADSPEMSFDPAEGGEEPEEADAEDDGIEASLPEAPETADAPEADAVETPDDDETTVTLTATYSDEAIAELKFMIEEEKLAGDVYDAFHEMYGLKIFENIGSSEDQHFDALIGFAENLGLDVDQFLFEPAGSFVDEALQEMYDTLLAQGSASATAALEVGVAIEEKDMIDIAAAAEAVEDTPLEDIYENLLAGSVNHLEAFESLLLA